MRNNQKGFALPLALLLFVVMTLMGLTLVSITVGDIKANSEKDYSQQAFYAAESGIAHGKKYLASQNNLSKGTEQYSKLKYCKPNLFPNLKDPTFKVMNDDNGKPIIGLYNLNQLITGSDNNEKERLSNFSFEYFITYSPDHNGNTDNPKKKPSTNKTYYTIFSCGCDGSKTKCKSQKNKIVALEAVVTLATQ